MFGSSTNKPLGTFTGFGSENSALGFSLFGGSTNNGTGLFGAASDKGTPVKFAVVLGNDSMVKNGITTNISTRHQCITAMSNYDKKSIEELRIEDYEAGRKKGGFSVCAGTAFSTSSSVPGPQPATGFGTPGSFFGSGPTNAVLFSQQQTTGGFGQNAGSQFGILGTTGTSAAPGFSFPSASKGFTFGATQTTTSLLTPTTTGSLFGSGSATAGLFGQQQTTEKRAQNTGGLFGTPTLSTTGASIFGQSSSGQTQEQPKDDQEVEDKDKAIGATGLTLSSTSTSKPGGFKFGNTSGTGFGASSSLFGHQSTTGFGATGSLFGSGSATAGLFGQQQTTEKLAQNAGSLFGTPTLSTTGTRIFGQSSSGQTVCREQPKGDQVVECKNEAIGATGFTLSSTSTSKGGLFGNTSGTGFGFSSSLFGQKPTTAFGATGNGSLSVSSSPTTGMFCQQQTAEGYFQKADALFNTTSSTTETEVKFGTTTSSTSELSTGLSFASSTSAGLRLPETKSTGFDCGRTQSDTGELLEEQQDDPPSLSPRFSLGEAMCEGMEELRKENESLRKVIKMYKENEKAMEELRRFYASQAIKHKENMEQAVSHKFLELVSKIRGLKTIRDTTPEDGKTSVVIREAIDLTRKNRIDLESLKSLHQVQECESALQQAQEYLRQCKGKEELLAADIVAQRDKARKELFDSIDLFCQEVDLIPLQERENSLQHALSQLEEQEDALDSCSTDPDLEVAVEAYEEWLQRSHQEVTDVKQRVNKCTEDLATALSRLELALKVSQDSSETDSIHAPFGDLDAMISSLSSAIQEEMDKSQVSEDEEAKQIVVCAKKALDIELNREMRDIQELRDNLVPKYKSLQTDISPWLEAKPDLKNVEEVRTTIESLRLRLRERLADKKDLEEVESDISDIYLQLHKSFEDESKFLAELARLTSEHFPELPIAHPDVGISEFLASNGLVKSGRELEHYPHYDSVPSVSHDKWSLIKTEFAGKPCILKELDADKELGGIEFLQRKAVEYHSVDCPFLMPLDAFFVTGSRAFIQMPLLISGEEWLTSHECSSEAITLVLRDILDALHSLHLKNICHGSVHLQSVFVEKRSGVYRGVLGFFPFSNSQCSQTDEMKSFGDLIVKMNFPNKDPTTTFSQLTEDTDLLAVLGDLLDTDDVDRLTAQQTLQQAYFCKCV